MSIITCCSHPDITCVFWDKILYMACYSNSPSNPQSWRTRTESPWPTFRGSLVAFWTTVAVLGRRKTPYPSFATQHSQFFTLSLPVSHDEDAGLNSRIILKCFLFPSYHHHYCLYTQM
jgi:hypothetical protein